VERINAATAKVAEDASANEIDEAFASRFAVRIRSRGTACLKGLRSAAKQKGG